MIHKDDQRNFILAIVLSMAVMLVWSLFYGYPRLQQQKQTQTQEAQKTGPQAPAAPGAPTAGAPAPVAATREGALTAAPRVPIETPSIRGSISLKGARIDDVVLKRYRETVDPKSANIVLLSPAGAPNAYYAEFGWLAGDRNIVLPNEQTVWTAEGTELTPDKPLVLSFDNGQGLVFKREFRVDANAMFTVTDRVENRTQAPLTVHPYALVSRHGTPHVAGYYVLHEGLIGVLGGKLQEVTYSGIEKETSRTLPSTGGFLGITDKYWAAAVVPDQKLAFDGRFSTALAGGLRTYQADARMEPQTIAPGATGEVTTRLFAGAKEVHAVNAYEQNLGIQRFDLMIDWGWFYFITKPLFQLLDALYRLFGNFGIAILLATVLVKGIFFPLANKSYASMAKMKAVQPAMMAIRERFPEDKLKQQQALMELYKKEKINPLAGCWPILVQIPVFFALYKVLFVTIEMRQAPFFGWIRDLAAPDPTSIFNLFGLLPFAPPDLLHVGIWPIIMGFTMFVQMKMNPEPTDPIQKTLFAWMPVIFTFMLASFPAGLVIYWTWNNLLSVLQQGVIMRKHGVKIELWGNLRNMIGRKAPAPGE